MLIRFRRGIVVLIHHRYVTPATTMNPNVGRITSQTNVPRPAQLSTRLMW